MVTAPSCSSKQKEGKSPVERKTKGFEREELTQLEMYVPYE